MKDWKAEYTAMKAQLAEMERQRNWWREKCTARELRDEETKRLFKDLLVRVLDQ